jgi:hypothetical protein
VTPSSSSLSDGIHGAIGGYNVVMFSAIAVVLIIGLIVWFRRR